ncbi:MAG: hypothetical protein ACRYGP_07110 [Janthinobacterium lividum]
MAKSNGAIVAGPVPTSATGGNVVDLLFSLRASIDRANAKKSPVKAVKSAAKAAPAKAPAKAAAKKAPAKRAPRKSA